jgi:transcriptional regulator with XRE-family HTH domain
MSVQKRFKKLLLELGLNASKAGKVVGVSPTSISRILHGESDPSRKVLSELIKQYGVNANWLLEDVGEMFINGKAEPMKLDKKKKTKDTDKKIALLEQENKFLKEKLEDKEAIIELLKK